MFFPKCTKMYNLIHLFCWTDIPQLFSHLLSSTDIFVYLFDTFLMQEQALDVLLPQGCLLYLYQHISCNEIKTFSLLSFVLAVSISTHWSQRDIKPMSLNHTVCVCCIYVKASFCSFKPAVSCLKYLEYHEILIIKLLQQISHQKTNAF